MHMRFLPPASAPPWEQVIVRKVLHHQTGGKRTEIETSMAVVRVPVKCEPRESCEPDVQCSVSRARSTHTTTRRMKSVFDRTKSSPAKDDPVCLFVLWPDWHWALITLVRRYAFSPNTVLQTNVYFDRLGLQVRHQSLFSQLSASTALLVTAEGQIVVRHVSRIDADRASLDLRRDAKGACNVASVHTSCRSYQYLMKPQREQMTYLRGHTRCRSQA